MFCNNAGSILKICKYLFRDVFSVLPRHLYNKINKLLDLTSNTIKYKLKMNVTQRLL